ncbi:MAG: tyrosine-type recombinase/integrase [Solirubrobacteraceae bacterium]
MRTRRSTARVEGRLAPFTPGFRVWLAERGYRPSSVEDQLWLMAHLSRWLDERGLEPAGLTAEAAERFRSARRERYANLTGARALDPLLGYLRGLDVVAVAPRWVDTAVERLLADYREYLLRERGLVAGSVRLRERVARAFLVELSEPLDVALHELGPGDVTAFVVQRCRSRRVGVAGAKTLTSGLRALLVFLHVAGWVPSPLVQAVPSVAGWRLSSLPRALEPEHVAGLLDSCDRATAIGRRDFAILLLLSRLGLRACEVAVLSLDDVDWRTGELTVRGKGSQTDRLPLPHDVGQALAEHLLARSRGVGCREVFLRTLAPYGPLSPRAIDAVVRRACDRAGVARVGTHRLRHTVASELLRAGAALTEIAPVLRHTNLSTTSIYAKVDRATLRTLARPWPVAGVVA